ncbi:RagB/SusD family nutrient uptake outer membrane protein [Zobellia nedashkovskayae]|uniref:RagB/SusD family nutrient uptake outer membrane protein n=1 Tax=Zobellia nedashkovskayae TaxID=2779510 RepID=UPI00188A2299|nr:RagB/SusD family nutrient uptake outer membrane protein [Zobellia nedashkovskayae]
MKNKLFIIGIIAVIIGIYSCDNDVLDRKPLDKISDEEVWQSESLMQGYVIDLYDRFPSFAYEDYFEYSDEGTGSSGNSNAITQGNMSKSNVPNDLEYWDYEYIRDCNIFLANVTEAPISDNVKTQLEGEVTTMRAVAYFEMAKRYGGVPLVSEVIDPFGEIAEELKKRNTEVEVYDFVDTELTRAVGLLENNESQTPTARINKWAALAFQARANLWAASIAKYGQVQLNGIVGVPESRADEFFQKAATAANTVLTTGPYELYNGKEDKAQNYQYIFLEEGNSEILFAKEFNGVEVRHDWDHWKAPARFASGQGARCNPTLDFILKYENVDGSTTDYTQFFNENNLYSDGWDLFKDKDPRLNATVLFQGSFFVDDEIQTYEGIDTGNTPDPSNIVNNPSLSYEGVKQVGVDSRLVVGDDKTTNSGFLIRKWCDEPNLPVPASQSQVDWTILRLAEVYITKAEAEFQLGNTAEAVAALNATRERAGISLVDESTITIEKIQTEWMAEFAFENKRFWDLRRWRIADEVLNNQFNGLKIIWHYNSDQYYFLPLLAETFNRVFRQEHYYLPITNEMLNNNPLLEQNPLY